VREHFLDAISSKPVRRKGGAQRYTIHRREVQDW
jgi:hypothetical protein